MTSPTITGVLPLLNEVLVILLFWSALQTFVTTGILAFKTLHNRQALVQRGVLSIEAADDSAWLVFLAYPIVALAILTVFVIAEPRDGTIVAGALLIGSLIVASVPLSEATHITSSARLPLVTFRKRVCAVIAPITTTVIALLSGSLLFLTRVLMS